MSKLRDRAMFKSAGLDLPALERAFAARDRLKAEEELAALRAKYASAVRTLQDIAAMNDWNTVTRARQRARNTLIQLGEPVEPEDV